MNFLAKLPESLGIDQPLAASRRPALENPHAENSMGGNDDDQFLDDWRG